MNNVGVCCGHCGGAIYFLTCPIHTEDAWVIASECYGCGFLNAVECAGCRNALKETT